MDLLDRRDWCHDGPQSKWCDRHGPGGFMGHTCLPDDPYLNYIVRSERLALAERMLKRKETQP